MYWVSSEALSNQTIKSSLSTKASFWIFPPAPPGAANAASRESACALYSVIVVASLWIHAKYILRRSTGLSDETNRVGAVSGIESDMGEGK